jgi:hypothetical protein
LPIKFWGQAQGDAPVCATLCLQRVAHLVGVDKGIFEVIDNIPGATLNGLLKDGITQEQMVDALHNLGLEGRVSSGLTNLITEVNATGKPVIAGVRTFNEVAYVGPNGNLIRSNYHAVVVEKTMMMNNQLGLVIYDPEGSFYWLPVESFKKYMVNTFVSPRF